MIKSAALEMFILTDNFPALECHGNFKRTNSFETDYGSDRFQYIISNPPYGGDKNKKSSEQLGIDKLLNHLKTEYQDQDNHEPWVQEQIDELMAKKQNLINSARKDCVNLNTCNRKLLQYAATF